MEHLGSGGFELAAKFVVLCLSGGEIRRMEETQLTPAIRVGRLVPSRRARRAHQYPLESPHHGVAIEGLTPDNPSLEFARDLQRLRPPSRSAI